MLSEKIESQTFALKILKGHLKSGRMAHCYLITGENSGVREELALAFAQALNCIQERFFQDCDCINCRKVLAQSHPDVIWVKPESGKSSIKIEAVRQVMTQASLKPYEGKWKVFILSPADGLTTDAANAFLKTLEEPPAETLFLLLAESKMHLIDTMISRSFEIRLRPVLSRQDDRLESLTLSLAAYGKRSWDDFLQTLPSKNREDLSENLLLLGEWLTQNLNQKSSSEMPKTRLQAWTKAVEVVLESKEAIDGNVNPKLALTRTAMLLEKYLPIRSMAA